MQVFKKVHLVLLLLLFECTLYSNGTILMALLLKVMALKGALFIGTPIALGSFIVGQGLGFFAGNLAGGYAVLKSAQKYHETEKAKWVAPSPTKVTTKGWQSPKYTKGYSKGYGVGNALAQFVNHVRQKPGGYHDYYDDGYGASYGYAGYQDVHVPYGQPVTSDYGPPAGHGGYPSASYGGYPAASYGYPDSYPTGTGYPPKEPTLVERLMSKLPSFLKPKEQMHAPPPGYLSPHAFAEGPYAADYAMHYPMDMYAAAPPPGQGYAPPPAQGYAPPHTVGGSDIAPAQPYRDSYLPQPQKLQSSAREPVKLFEDSEYTYSSSPYAKPQPKRPVSAVSASYASEHYPGDATHYDGPAKEYTGVMTDYYQAIQKMKTKHYGDRPLGKPMGSAEFSVSITDDYGTASSEMLAQANALTNAYAQKRKDTKVKPNAKLTPNYIIEKFLEKKLAEKAQRAKDEAQKREVKQLIHTLRQAYLQQLEESLRAEDSEEEEPLKAERAEEEEPLKAERSEEEEPLKAERSEEEKPLKSERSEEEEPLSEETTPVPTTEKAHFVPFVTISPNRFKREHVKDARIPESRSAQIPESMSARTRIPKSRSARIPESMSAQIPESRSARIPVSMSAQIPESRSARIPDSTDAPNPLSKLSSEQLEQVKMLYSFMEEIKQFFTLVSALDEDTCLQKMVCDVHAQKAQGEETENANTYVTNMVSTFAIMDAIVPFDPSGPEDSTTKYRLAAKIGSVGGSVDVCRRYFTLCNYTTEQIIQLGNQVAAASTTPTPDPPSSTTPAPYGQRLQRKLDDPPEEEESMPRV